MGVLRSRIRELCRLGVEMLKVQRERMTARERSGTSVMDGSRTGTGEGGGGEGVIVAEIVRRG